MQETQEIWDGSPGWEDPLKEEMATHSNILAWKIPWAEQPGQLQFMTLQKSDTTEDSPCEWLKNETTGINESKPGFKTSCDWLARATLRCGNQRPFSISENHSVTWTQAMQHTYKGVNTSGDRLRWYRDLVWRSHETAESAGRLRFPKPYTGNSKSIWQGDFCSVQISLGKWFCF